MKKRYIGVIQLTPSGDGVIHIVGEEYSTSLQKIEATARKGPLLAGECS